MRISTSSMAGLVLGNSRLEHPRSVPSRDCSHSRGRLAMRPTAAYSAPATPGATALASQCRTVRQRNDALVTPASCTPPLAARAVTEVRLGLGQGLAAACQGHYEHVCKSESPLGRLLTSRGCHLEPAVTQYRPPHPRGSSSPAAILPQEAAATSRRLVNQHRMPLQEHHAAATLGTSAMAAKLRAALARAANDPQRCVHVSASAGRRVCPGQRWHALPTPHRSPRSLAPQAPRAAAG